MILLILLTLLLIY